MLLAGRFLSNWPYLPSREVGVAELPKKRGVRAKTDPGKGTVFVIPLPDGGGTVGQVVEVYKGTTLYVTVLAIRWGAGERMPEVMSALGQADSVLYGNTFDAKIMNGDWPVLGVGLVDHSKHPLPNYRVDMGGHTLVETFDASRRRPLQDWEFEKVPLRRTLSPMRFQDITAAVWGLEPWDSAYNDMRPTHVRIASSVVV